MGDEPHKRYIFDEFELNPDSRQLLRDGQPVHLTNKPFHVLLYLIENRGHLITRRELLEKFWDGHDVYDETLTKCVGAIRKALKDISNDPRFIQTHWAEGYRFVGEVEEQFPHIEKIRAVKITVEEDDETEKFVETLSDLKTPPRPAFLKKRAFAFAAAGLLLLSVIGVFIVNNFSSRQSENPKQTGSAQDVKSIVVLPFKTINAEGEEESLGAGISETLVIKLSGVKSLLVKQPGILIRETDASPDPVKIGGELKTDAILEGTVQKAGERIRLTARLVRVNDGASLWADTFDEEFTNIFAVQDSISEKVVNALSLHLTGSEQRQLAKRYTEDAESYRLYLLGKYHWNKYSKEGFNKAVEYFNWAIERDPNYARAYSGLADTYMLLAVESYRDPREVCPKAKIAAEKALSIDPELAEGYVSIGIYHIFYAFDWNAAETAFKRALELNPRSADARHFYSHYLQGMARGDEAVGQMKAALESDPYSLIINTEYGWAYYLARWFDEALLVLRQTKEMDPNFFVAYLPLAQSYIQKKMYREAVAELTKANELSERHPWIESELACAYALSGRRSDALKIVREFETRSEREFFEPYLIAVIYIALDDKEKAFEWLEKAFEIRSNWLLWLKVEPKFDPLRDDSRFQDLLRRMKL